jgi:hypothetical protein
MNPLADFERKVWSQHGEDGIIIALTDSLKERNQQFVEIGATWQECNSRNLSQNGWTGWVYDRGDVSQFDNGIQRKVTPATAEVPILEPDFFSLDIDSYDYYIADALLRKGFRPKVVCVEFNSFLGGTNTVPYIEPHDRYKLQPRYGLYFGAALDAWKHLWKGWRYVGMESSCTNAFFVREDQSDWPGTDFFDHQTYFCRKYSKTGDQLRKTMEGMRFVDVTTSDYEREFAKAAGIVDARVEMVATFRAEDYDAFAGRFIATFGQHWPQSIELHCYEEPYTYRQDSLSPPNVKIHDLEEASPELIAFRDQYADNKYRGYVKGRYNYMFDALKWSHRIFALAAHARKSRADILINIDADILTFDKVPADFIADLLPDGADIAYMPRPGFYSECSFVLYRLSNPLVREFIEEHEKIYKTGLIFNIRDGWTDCHAFDALMRVYRRHGLSAIDINEGLPQSMHPFLQGPLGKYMDHLKGARKKEGKSRKSDLIVPRKEAYWQ